MPTAPSVPGAMVTLTNEATSVSLTTETSESGTYAFDLVQAGKYTRHDREAGVQKIRQSGNPVNINQPATVNATLETGGLTETVTGAGRRRTGANEHFRKHRQHHRAADTRESADRRHARHAIRSTCSTFNRASCLAATPAAPLTSTAHAIALSISRSTASTSTSRPPAAQTSRRCVRIPIRLQEFQVVTSNFTAELGRSSGAQVTLVTKLRLQRFSRQPV